MKKPRSGKRQYGALCVRPQDDGSLGVLLITSRETRRWVIPKGWPMRGRTNVEAALIEAYEEAGVLGRALVEKGVGSYRYGKLLRSGLMADLQVKVFVYLVEEQLADWPERTERTVQWFSPLEAAAVVAEPGLAKLIRHLPRTLTGIDLTGAGVLRSSPSPPRAGA